MEFPNLTSQIILVIAPVTLYVFDELYGMLFFSNFNGINGDAYGRYERGDVRPTIEMAIRIADALQISLDYLTGKTALEIDQPMLKRMEQVAQMSDKDKDYVYTLMDAFIARTRIQGLV